HGKVSFLGYLTISQSLEFIHPTRQLKQILAVGGPGATSSCLILWISGAEVTQHIPDVGVHLARDYEWHSNESRVNDPKLRRQRWLRQGFPLAPLPQAPSVICPQLRTVCNHLSKRDSQDRILHLCLGGGRFDAFPRHFRLRNELTSTHYHALLW